MKRKTNNLVDSLIDGLVDLAVEETRKQTAKEILTDIYNCGLKTYRGIDRTECFVEVSFDILYQIAKEYGVEVK